MKTLEIILVGPRGSGKTTIARLLKRTLSQHGIVIKDVDDKDIDKPRVDFNLDYCLESLSERVEVKISTSSEKVHCKKLESKVIWS